MALKSIEVSAMIKQGFISDQTLSFSPSRTTTTTTTTATTRVYSPASSPTSNTLLSPPASPFPSSPAPTQPPARPAHSQTLYEMMSDEQHRESRLSDEKRRKLHDRVARLLDEAPFRNAPGDVRLAVVGRDGFRVSMDVHKSVLAEKSRFFAEKLKRDRGVSHLVEISDCDGVEVYVEAVLLMYCEDLKRRLMGEEVSKVLGLLKVSAAIMFDAGIMSCLEYLEVVPWSEDEEEKVISHLNQLQLHDSYTAVLLRVSSEPSTSTRSDDIFLRLLNGVLQAKDDKARREMKSLISRLLREDAANDSNRRCL